MVDRKKLLEDLDKLRQEFLVEEDDEKSVFEHTKELEEEIELLERQIGGSSSLDDGKIGRKLNEISVRVNALETQMEKTLEKMDYIKRHAESLRDQADNLR